MQATETLFKTSALSNIVPNVPEFIKTAKMDWLFAFLIGWERTRILGIVGVTATLEADG